MGDCFSQPLQKVTGPSKDIIGGPKAPNSEEITSKQKCEEILSNDSNDNSDSYDYEEYSTEDKNGGPNAPHIIKIRKVRKQLQLPIEPRKSEGNIIVLKHDSSIKIQTSPEEISPSQSRPYFSFTAFMIQNPNPQIYEWQFGEEIGKGSLSQIFLVRHSETDQVCAAKVYNNSVLHLQTVGSNNEQPLTCIQREIDVLCSISHPNIMPILEFIEDNPTNSLILVFPYATKGNFGDHINLSQQQQSGAQDSIMTFSSILVCFYQISKALLYVHSFGYVHRNITPTSIFVLDDFYFVLSKFKLAEQVKLDKNSARDKFTSKHNKFKNRAAADEKFLDDIKGSPLFLSPEACSGKPYNGKYNDIWSLGITFYLVFFGKLPFNLSEKSPALNSVTKALAENSLEFPEFAVPAPNKEMEKSVQTIISKLLEKDPRKRISLEECISMSIFDEAKEITNQQQKESATESKE